MKTLPFYLAWMLVFLTSIALASEQLHIVGRVETGMLMDQSVRLSVKMDTGAKTSSLHAHDIKIYDKDGKKWVSFMIDTSHFEKEYQFDYPLKRMVRIKKRQSEINEGETFERRPVIEMELCLGTEVQLVEINLNDRSNFLYPMLLGRTAMEQFGILIDPAEVFSAKPLCKVIEKEQELEQE